MRIRNRRIAEFATLPIVYHLALALIAAAHSQFSSYRSWPCGKTLVAHGNDDKRVQSPWTALVFRKTSTTKGVHAPWVSGVIVGPNTVLTRGRQFWEPRASGQRMQPLNLADFLVGVGIHDRDSFDLDGVTQLLEVASIRPHPKSWLEHSEFDYAIIQLRQRILLSSKVHPICLESPQNASFTSPYDYDSKFFKAPKRVSGYLRGGQGRASTVHVTPYKLKPTDVCDAECQARAPSSTAEQLGNGGAHCPTAPGPAPAHQDEINDIFQVGASIASWNMRRWYLAGIVTNTYRHAHVQGDEQGCSAPAGSQHFKHFVSLVAASGDGNLNWINANVDNGPSQYTCLDGAGVSLGRLCDGTVDCTGERADRGATGSDEEPAYCGVLNCSIDQENTATAASGSSRAYRVKNGTNVIGTSWAGGVMPGSGSRVCPGAPGGSPQSNPNFAHVSPSRAPAVAPSLAAAIGRVPSMTGTAAHPHAHAHVHSSVQIRPPSAAGLGVVFPQSTTRHTTTTTRTTTMTAPSTSTSAPTTSHIFGGASAMGTGTRCPPLGLTQKEKEGIKFQCVTPDQVGAAAVLTEGGAGDCSERPQPTGTKMIQSCLPGYKSGGRVSFSEMVCGPDGIWQRGRYLACIVECGLPKTSLTGHIVNGTEAEPSNWPWNAALFKIVKDKFVYLCGATLVSSNALVTAAHCLHGHSSAQERDRFRVVLAPVSSVYSANANSAHSQIMHVGSIHVHELYNADTFEADIAVIKTGAPVHINNHVYPACFPFPGRENEQIERFQTSPGSVGVVTGFGVDETAKISETLRQVSLPVVSVRDCFRVLDVFPLTTQMCAGYTTGVSVCNGDSGSGFLFQEEGTRKLYFLQGIVSHGPSAKDSRSCDYNKYSVFTKVGPFKDWVEGIVAAD